MQKVPCYLADDTNCPLQIRRAGSQTPHSQRYNHHTRVCCELLDSTGTSLALAKVPFREGYPHEHFSPALSTRQGWNNSLRTWQAAPWPALHSGNYPGKAEAVPTLPTGLFPPSQQFCRLARPATAELQAGHRL